MAVVDEEVNAAAQLKARRRALDIEAGLAWTALFGTLPTQYSWNATKARKAGAEAFGRDQLGFTSRVDGHWYPWPSPQRIGKDFAGEHAGLSGMECYRKTVTNLRKKLRERGTPYKPIVRSDKLGWAQLQARARHNSGPQPMAVPPEVQCASLRRHSFERESPWLGGSNTTGPIRIAAVQDRGICVMSSVDSAERWSFFAHTLSIDMLDPTIGVMIAASTTQIQVLSPKGPVPDLAELADATSQQHRSGGGCLSIPEVSAEHGVAGDDATRQAGGRPCLLATLEWARRHQHDLIELGPMSVVIAEGESILPEIVAFIDGFTAGPVAAAITLDPTGSHDEALLVTRATWSFEATQFVAPDPGVVVDRTHDMTTAEAKILRRMIETA